jgi:hypothetical protein
VGKNMEISIYQLVLLGIPIIKNANNSIKKNYILTYTN